MFTVYEVMGRNETFLWDNSVRFTVMENYNGLPGKAGDPCRKKYSESLKDTALEI